MSNTKQQHFDLAIAGGGSNGCALALALSRSSGLKIAIVEAQPFLTADTAQQLHPGFDARVVALAKHSYDLLQGFGVDELDKIATSIKHIHVSDRGHIGQCQLHHQDYNLPALGYVVELQRLGEALQNQLSAADNSHISWFCPEQIQALQQHQDAIDITLTSGAQLSAKLLVVAEGGNSPTRELLNINTEISPYAQIALIANVMTNKPHNNWAFERFTEHGPLALLPLSGTDETQQVGDVARCSLVWTIEPDQQQALMDASDADFLAQLQSAFGYRLGKFNRVGERFCYPLQLVRASTSVTHRAAVIGNAAQSLHPIAGQGLNLGLRDVEALCQCILEAVQSGDDIGQYSVLRAYEQSRKSDQNLTIGMTDGLVRIFSNNYLPLVTGRNLGLLAMNQLPQLKTQLARQAMGLNSSQWNAPDKLDVN